VAGHPIKRMEKRGPPLAALETLAWREASILEKSHPDSLLMAIRNIYICARDNINNRIE
jgi:hypothetical protein